MPVPESNADAQVLAELAPELTEDWGEDDGVPAAEPETEGSDEQAAQRTPEAPAEPSGEDEFERFLDRPIPASPQYPKILHGQPMRKLVERQQSADELIQRQGEEKNAALERARVLEATVKVLTNKIQAGGTFPTQPPASGTYPGFDEKDVLDHPQRFAEGTAEMARQRAIAEITPIIGELRQDIETSKQKERVTAVSTAAEAARQELGVDPATWRQAGEFMWARAGQLNPYDPASWKSAWEGMLQVLPAAQSKATPQVGMTKGAPPGATRSTATTAPGAKPIKPRVRNWIADSVKVAGLPPEIAEEIEAEYRAAMEGAKS